MRIRGFKKRGLIPWALLLNVGPMPTGEQEKLDTIVKIELRERAG